MTTPSNNANKAARQLARMRRDAHSNAGTTGGYIGEDGQARAATGDRQAPYGKTPPFPTDVFPLFTADALIAQAFDQTLIEEAIDVEAARVFTLYHRYVAQVNNSQLYYGLAAAVSSDVSIFPSTAQFFAPAVLDPVLNIGAPFSTAARRTAYGALLQSPVLAAADVYQLTVSFDVSAFRQVILLVGEFGAGVNLGGGYAAAYNLNL